MMEKEKEKASSHPRRRELHFAESKLQGSLNILMHYISSYEALKSLVTPAKQV